MSSDLEILNAEARMGINRFANPYFVQVILLFFILGPFFAGAAVSRAVASQPSLADASTTYGQVVTGIIYFLILIFGMKTFQDANSADWFEINYWGDKAVPDWTGSFRIESATLLGVAEPLTAPVEGQSAPKWGIKTPNYGTVNRPWSSKARPLGDCWEIKLHDKYLPITLAWLPKDSDFDKIFHDRGHMLQVFFRGFPFTLKKGRKGVFIRTNWTKDPGGKPIPIGIFSHTDLLVDQLRLEIEPIEASQKEVQGLAQVRDNYYRHGLALELESANTRIKTLENELKEERKRGLEYGGALFLAAKNRHKKEAPKLDVANRKSQIGIIAVVVILVAVAVLGMIGRLHG
jgi:hypothetical protein